MSYTKPKRAQDYMSVSLSQTMTFLLTKKVQGGTPDVDTVKPLTKMYAIKAGLSNEDFYAYGDTFWKTWQIGQRQFSTFQPNYKRVDIGQEEYLYFLMNFTPKPSELRVQYHNADGTSSEAVTAMTLSSPMLFSVVCCPVGIAALGVSVDAVRYDVWSSMLILGGRPDLKSQKMSSRRIDPLGNSVDLMIRETT